MRYLDDVVTETRWMELIRRTYINKNNIGVWDFVRRKSKSGGHQSIVVIVPKTVTNDFIIIKQYRAPFDDYIYEFPAGLVDEGESLKEAAKRELKEETGYDGFVTSVGGPIASSCGLTDETVHLVYMDISEMPGESSPEESEDIEVFKLNQKDIPEFLRKNEEGGHVFGAKLYCVLKGYDN